MNFENLEQNSGSLDKLSRRGLLTGAALLAAVPASRADDDDRNDRNGSSSLAYVGCYTPNGLGIYLFRLSSNGKLTQVNVFTTPNPSPTSVSATSPSWLALSPDKKTLYAANEISNYNGTTTGAVSAFRVAASTGNLTFLNTVSSQGSGPAHLSVHPSGKYVFVANYGGGNVAVIAVNPDGSLGAATDVVADNSVCTPGPCPLGPTMAAEAPPGSFARSGHDAPHAHMIQSDPAGNYIICNDLGLDLTIVWKFDAVNGKLLTPKTVPSSAGAGPRHFAFHPNGRWFYSLNEEASTLAFMTYEPSTGTLTPRTEISTLPSNFVGTNYTSEIMVAPNGRYIYCANRLHDTIAIFSIDGAGRPELVDEEWTRGDYPRSFNIDPSGNYMFTCNQRSDAIATFRVDGNGKKLTFADRYTPVGSPAIIIFL